MDTLFQIVFLASSHRKRFFFFFMSVPSGLSDLEGEASHLDLRQLLWQMP